MPSATITSSKFPDSLEKIAKVSFVLGVGRELYSNRDLFYGVESSEKKTETYIDLGDIGGLSKHSGSVDYQDVKENYKTTITNFLWSGGIRIEYEWSRVDQLRIAKQLPDLLGLAVRRVICQQSIAWFNFARSSYTTKDTLALASTAHTSAVGGANQSNVVTTPFSGINLTSAKILMRKFLSNRDNELEILPDTIVAGIDLEDAMNVANKSQGEVWSTTNNINVHKGMYTTITDVRITDTNNWALIDSGLMKKMNIWQEVDPIEFKKTYSEDELTQKYLVTTFFGNGSTGWEWILYADVTG